MKNFFFVFKKLQKLEKDFDQKHPNLEGQATLNGNVKSIESIGGANYDDGAIGRAIEAVPRGQELGDYLILEA